MANLLTPLDMMGELIDPRAEDEPLHEYKDRLSDVAGALATRSFANIPGEQSWREAREQELQGRVGTSVDLTAAYGDAELIEQADDQALTWDSISDRKGPIRWPRIEARGRPPRFGAGTAAGPGGAATPDTLRPDGRLTLEPGYVLSGGELWYVPGELNTLSFQLPPSTNESVLVPWQIFSGHGHRIVPQSETELKLVAGDGHEHVIEAVRGEDPTQTGYNSSSTGPGTHTHSINVASVSGPAFAQTRPQAPTSNTGGGPLSVADKTSIGPGRPVKVPRLEAQTVTTQQTNDVNHAHSVLVSPHDYWSGDFLLVGTDHMHKVRDWVVEESLGHTHVVDKPTIPDTRPLIPRLTKYENDRLLEASNSPYVLNVRIEKGWPVASAPQGFSGQLLLGYDGGSRVEPPKEFLASRDSSTVLGLGPDSGCARLRTDVAEARAGSPIELYVRAEDQYTGGIAGTAVSLSWDGGSRSQTQHTDRQGRASYHIPTEAGKNTYTLTIEAQNGTTRQLVVELDVFGERGGYGIDWGDHWGS
jgi:hypothetical protein